MVAKHGKKPLRGHKIFVCSICPVFTPLDNKSLALFHHNTSKVSYIIHVGFASILRLARSKARIKKVAQIKIDPVISM